MEAEPWAGLQAAGRDLPPHRPSAPWRPLVTRHEVGTCGGRRVGGPAAQARNRAEAPSLDEGTRPAPFNRSLFHTRGSDVRFLKTKHFYFLNQRKNIEPEAVLPTASKLRRGTEVAVFRSFPPKANISSRTLCRLMGGRDRARTSL